MPVSADTLRDHLAYTSWATHRLLDAAAKLSTEELARDFGTSERSLIGTLAHIYAGDRVWLSRLDGSPFPGFTTDADRDLTVLQRDWPALYDRFRGWAAGLSDEAVLATLTYQDLKGNTWSQPIW